MTALRKRLRTVAKVKLATTKTKNKRSATTKTAKPTKRTKTTNNESAATKTTKAFAATKTTKETTKESAAKKITSPSGSKLKSPPKVIDATTIDLSLKLSALQKEQTTSFYLQDDVSLGAADVPSPPNQKPEEQKQVSQRVFTILASYGDKWNNFLEQEEYQLVDGTKIEIPKILTMCSGPVNNQKIGIANYMLIDYNARVKK